MDQDIEGLVTNVCCSCLSSDRDLVSINGLVGVYQIFKLLVHDLTVDRFSMPESDVNHLACWECVSLLKRFGRFKKQVQNAQDHLRVLGMSSGQGALDHTYMSQSLSNLDICFKRDFDKIFYEYSSEIDWDEQILMEGAMRDPPENVKAERLDVAQSLRQNIQFEAIRTPLDNALPGTSLILDTPDSNVSHILIREVSDLDDNFMLDSSPGADQYDMATIKGELEYNTIEIGSQLDSPQPAPRPNSPKEKRCGFTVEYMTQEAMLASREQMKEKLQYASAVYKCELCIIGFYTRQQVEEHFVAMHRGKEDLAACKVCYCYFEEKKLHAHLDSHYMRYECKLCQHVEYSSKIMQIHVKSHLQKTVPDSVILMDSKPTSKRGRKRKATINTKSSPPCKPGDLRRLLSKKTIECYQCLECDMFFKTSRARKTHLLKTHREGLQCDHCKKRFVNKTTLTTHMKLHEGPLPRSECPVCHKQVRDVQIKYHIQRHSTRGRYSCDDCRKVFSYLSTYHAHLKYSRAHAQGELYRFPCPMCNKGYLTKEEMQDHFNYQHLGKTAHKCPICDKPIASRVNVGRHMARVHGEKKPRPRSHVCQLCGKGFTDRKALIQHEVIHSGERPLVCDICHQTFKQKASLYTHKKRVHKVFPAKKIVEFMDSKITTV